MIVQISNLPRFFIMRSIVSYLGIPCIVSWAHLASGSSEQRAVDSPSLEWLEKVNWEALPDPEGSVDHLPDLEPILDDGHDESGTLPPMEPWMVPSSGTGMMTDPVVASAILGDAGISGGRSMVQATTSSGVEESPGPAAATSVSGSLRIPVGAASLGSLTYGELIVALEIFVVDPGVNSDAFVKEIASRRGSTDNAEHLYQLVKGRVRGISMIPFWIHRFMLDRSDMMPHNATGLVEMIRTEADATGRSFPEIAANSIIMSWYRYCIEPLVKRFPMHEPPLLHGPVEPVAISHATLSGAD